MNNTSPHDLSHSVKRQMSRLHIHEAWEGTYRTGENELFSEQTYDDLVRRLRLPTNSRALDIGCGICANSIRLARRGFLVSAADYSESILVQARESVARNQLSDRISLGREDILNLSFPNDHFDLVLCWGVLMHIPNAERAVSELARVAKPGGFVVLEEINQNAPEAWMMRLGWSMFKRNITITKCPAGYEQISHFKGESLFWRHTNKHWLIAQFARHACTLVQRDGGTFSDLYIYAPGQFTKSVVHAWNRFWARHINLPQPAYHNVFIFRKNPD
jgi:ubiquinone/menaquinone biosynthesis C-methylase UbiE